MVATQTTTAESLLTCLISDYVFDLDGTPIIGAAVNGRLTGRNIQGRVGITDTPVAAVTNENGQFFLSLARLAEVEVAIPRMNYSRRLTVPNQATARLFTLP